MLVCVILPYKTTFGNLLYVVNVVKFRCVLNSLLLETLAVVDQFLRGYKAEVEGSVDG
jgi:hypothetical protein